MVLLYFLSAGFSLSILLLYLFHYCIHLKSKTGREEIRTPGFIKASNFKLDVLDHSTTRPNLQLTSYILRLLFRNCRYRIRTYYDISQCFYRASPLPIRKICNKLSCHCRERDSNPTP